MVSKKKKKECLQTKAKNNVKRINYVIKKILISRRMVNVVNVVTEMNQLFT